jgi:hypothetical protein
VSLARGVQALLCTAVIAVGCSDSPQPVASSSKRSQRADAPQDPLPAAWLKGKPVDARWRSRPRFRPQRESPKSLRAMPDGDLGEWRKLATWITGRPVAGNADSGKLALASYGSGLSLAAIITDNRHVGAKAVSALSQSDHLELELWPGEKAGLAAVHVRVGTVRQLVDVLKPSGEPWRVRAISSAGVPKAGGGYVVEARLPLSVLTPLPTPKIKTLRYRVTVFDADGDSGARAAPGIRFEGRVTLDPPLMVPEAVQKRGSIRVCMATQRDSLWTYLHGWRCGVPHRPESFQTDDAAKEVAPMLLGHARVPEAAKIVWIRERLMFVNILGLERGVGALLDKRDTILSVVPLGVVGAFDPGNPRTHDSGAEGLELPDGTYAVAVTHTFPARLGPLGGRCRGGNRIYLSILALRGCLKSTPHKPAPDPPFTPFIEEVFRTLLEGCQGLEANDWRLSRDRRTITVHSSVHPNRPVQRWVFNDGQYVRAPAGVGATTR